MPSLADALEVARSRKRMPYYAEGSTRDLARKLDIDAPISTQELIRQLGDLAPAGYRFKEGPDEARFVHYSASLYIQSDGAIEFTGSAREEGFFGSNFLITATLLDVKDAQGRALTFAHSDTLAGKNLPGFSEKNWTIRGRVPIIADQWEQARNSRIRWNMHVSTDPLQVTEVVVGGVLIAIVGYIFLAFLIKGPECPPGQEWRCEWEQVRKPIPEHPEEGSGAALVCTCRDKL